MKKYLLGLIGIIGLGLINFSSSYSCLTDTEFTVSTDSYFYMYNFEFSSSAGLNIYNSDYNYSFNCVSDWCYINNNSTDDTVNNALLLNSGIWTIDSDGFTTCLFDLIPVGSTEECSTCESTFSTLFVNGSQITGSNNIYIYTPDHFVYTPNYYTGYMDLNIENEGDTEYIENVLSIQTYHPDKDQFAMSFAGFLTLLMPYIIITLFIIFVWKLIRRIFR